MRVLCERRVLWVTMATSGFVNVAHQVVRTYAFFYFSIHYDSSTEFYSTVRARGGRSQCTRGPGSHLCV